jgi:surface carbohydrate biosynthesis protein (TIGR04326 family)
MKLIILFNKLPGNLAINEEIFSSGEECIIFACPGSEGIARGIEKRYPCVKRIIDAKKRLVSIAKTEQRFLTHFLAEWPEKAMIGRRTFKDYFRWKALPLWWFCLPSEKNFLTSKLFEILCYAILLKTILEEEKPDEAFLASNDSEFSAIVPQIFQNTNTQYTFLSGKPDVQQSLLRILLKFLKRFLLELFDCFILRRVTAEVSRSCDKARVLFFTSFPRHWERINAGYMDRYYHRLKTENENGMKSCYLASLIENRLVLGLAEVRELRGKYGKIKSDGFLPIAIYLERFKNPFTILHSYLIGLVYLLRYLSLRNNKELKRSFVYKDFDLSPLFINLFDESFLQVPGLLSVCMSAERIFRKIPADLLVLYGFEFRFGRMLVHTARQMGLKTIGIQHGPITRTKGLYSYYQSEMDDIPLPDKILVDGEMSYHVFTENNNVLQNRVIVTGAPRFDGLAQKLEKARKGKKELTEREKSESKGIIILVTPGHTDTEAVIKTLCSWLKDRSEWFKVILKSHPLVGKLGEQIFEKTFSGLSNVKMEVSGENVHELMVRSDILVNTYSSCAVEAIMLGLPVVCMNLGIKSYASPLFDLEGFDGWISTADEFAEFLQNLPVQREKIRKLQRFVERNYFYKLDGNATERMVEIIHTLKKESNS